MKAWCIRPAIAALITGLVLFSQRMKKKIVKSKDLTPATPLEEKSIRQDFWIKDKLVVIEKVPAGVCPQCGEKVVKAEVGEHIAELLKDSNRINRAPTISVPFIKFDAEPASFESV